ncbi:IS701 family transposase [Streptomyces desertarenae]|uniref:IS701 family transposase n=1 Tax=Streptomyces desertarenae TaxID=2666184 RepID=UPI003AA8BD52
MTSEESAGVREDLEAFAAELFDGFFRADQRRWGQAYVRGLLLDGRRKSVEPMAARLGEDGNRQALAHFITSSPWDAAHVRARPAWRMHEAIGPEALITDDTGFLKDGDASACAARQYTRTAGRVTNCQAGVSVHLATDRAPAAIDWRLFLPASWDPASPRADADKAARRTRCGIPDHVGHVEKWQLALDMIDETRSWGIGIPPVVADAGYGDAAAFRHGLEERGLTHAVGISSRHTAHPAEARPVQPAYAGAGRPPKARYPEPAQTVKGLVVAAGKAAARPVSWREGSRPGTGRSGVERMYPRFVALRIRPAGRASAGPPMIRSCPNGGCWRSGRPPSRNRCGSGCRTCPRHAAGHPGAAGQAQLAHRARLPRDGTSPGPGPLRGPHLYRRLPYLPPRRTHTHTNLTEPS